MASSTIDEYTAEKIDEIRNEAKKQEDRLLVVSKKMEYFAEGNVFLAGAGYQEACKRFEQVLKLEPNNKLALKLLGSSSTMEAVYAGFPPHVDEKKKAIAATRARDVFLKLLNTEGETQVAFDLARAYALLGNKELCRKYLLLAEEAKTLPDRDQVLLFGMFDSVREENWFTELQSRQWEKR